jgi:hypothetical protein
MKYFKIVAFIFVSVVMLAFKAQYSGALMGTILPLEGIQEIMVVSGPDTIKVTHSNGSFLLKNLEPKTYTVLVKAVPPYQDYTLNDVAVIDSATTDIGQIKLLQE